MGDTQRDSDLLLVMSIRLRGREGERSGALHWLSAGRHRSEDRILMIWPVLSLVISRAEEISDARPPLLYFTMWAVPQSLQVGLAR